VVERGSESHSLYGYKMRTFSPSLLKAFGAW